MQSKSLRLSDGLIHYLDTGGDLPAVLLVHGNGLSSSVFLDQLRGLSDRYRLIAPDFFAHGQSESSTDPAARYTFAGFARFIREVSLALDLRRFVLVGQSLGGHAAIQGLPNLPEVRALGLIGAPPLRGTAGLAEAFLPDPTDGLLFKATFSSDDTRKLAATFLSPKPGRPDGIEALAAEFAKADGTFRTSLLESIMAGEIVDESAIVKSMRIPLAMFVGEQDQLIRRSYYDDLSLPSLWLNKVTAFASGGHVPNFESPTAFNASLCQFIDSLNPIDFSESQS